ncbi:MAG: hypothetical protein ACUVT5_07520 [Candidatus Bathyarchaeales archaeon]
MQKLSTKDIALVAVFAPLYAIFCSWSLFPLIGASGKAITASAILAPIIGLILAPYLSALAVILGGAVGLSFGYFSPFSYGAGIAAACLASALYNREQALATLVYVTFLSLLALYPMIGPAWLYPNLLWLQIVGLIVLASPLQSKAIVYLRDRSSPSRKLMFGVGVTVFTATMFAHVVGSLLFEMLSWPFLISNVETWIGVWQAISLVYPFERLTIVAVATVLTTGLMKSLKKW